MDFIISKLSASNNYCVLFVRFVIVFIVAVWLGEPSGHLLEKRYPFSFSLQLFFFMPPKLFVLLFCLASGTGCEKGIYV